MNSLSSFFNHISNVVCYAGISGSLGCYLAHRAIHQIDPYTGLICGAVAGATTVLFFNENANFARKTIGIAILVFVPQKICEHLLLPATTLQVCLVVTGLTTALALFIQIFHQACITKQKRIELELDLTKLDQQFEEVFEEIFQETEEKFTDKNLDKQSDSSEKYKKFDKVLENFKEIQEKKRMTKKKHITT